MKMKSKEVYRVKQYPAIIAQKDFKEETVNGFYANRLFFNFDMAIYCGTKVTLKHKQLKYVWSIEENGRFWHESWLENWIVPDFLKNEDFEL